MKYASGLKPYTPAEREQDAAERRAMKRRERIRQQALLSGQPYFLPGTPATRRRDLRMMGETDENLTD